MKLPFVLRLTVMTTGDHLGTGLMRFGGLRCGVGGWDLLSFCVVCVVLFVYSVCCILGHAGGH